MAGRAAPDEPGDCEGQGEPDGDAARHPGPRARHGVGGDEGDRGQGGLGHAQRAADGGGEVRRRGALGVGVRTHRPHDGAARPPPRPPDRRRARGPRPPADCVTDRTERARRRTRSRGPAAGSVAPPRRTRPGRPDRSDDHARVTHHDHRPARPPPAPDRPAPDPRPGADRGGAHPRGGGRAPGRRHRRAARRARPPPRRPRGRGRAGGQGGGARDPDTAPPEPAGGGTSWATIALAGLGACLAGAGAVVGAERRLRVRHSRIPA